MAKSKKTTIVLGEKDVALVFKEDGELNFYFDENAEEANPGTIVLGSISLLLGEGNKELTRLIDQRYKKMVRNVKEREKVVKKKTQKKST